MRTGIPGTRLLARRSARASALALALLVVASALLPALSPHRHDATDLATGATPPSLSHPFGTDDLGRDLFVRVLFGCRISLAVAFVVTLLALVIGVPWGAIAAYRGGRVDAAMMRVAQTVQAAPFVVMIILLEVFFARRGGALHRAFATIVSPFVAHGADPAWFPVFRVLFLFVALGIFWWPSMARIVRGQVLELRGRPFVEAARAAGAGHGAILRRHILPNALGPILAQATLIVPEAMVAEATLSFLGLGTEEPLASLGSLVARGAEAMALRPWLLVIPALFLALVAFCINVLGDALRDALDPRARRR
ncbi:ABC transporter permease [Polyangium aurulentum]|uniref:ABC transporter permease n=1 Tax=Polyangium aurulentum TaxID=2567896 RepID=UPI0010AE6489|nr:ABC transporter permease [Polyangium aurulentum]UQA61168.1 ABC transporter permease [Polyangium aurulentum]